MSSFDVIMAAGRTQGNLGTVIRDELRSKGVPVKEFSRVSGIPANTLYKIISGERRDIRLSTLRAIVGTLKDMEGPAEAFIAVLASRPVLDAIKARRFTFKGGDVVVREYGVSTFEDTLVAAVRAEKEGAKAIVCAPIASTTVERLVDLPVAVMMPKETTLLEAIETAAGKVD
jgi:predicted transcriptional regulator